MSGKRAKSSTSAASKQKTSKKKENDSAGDLKSAALRPTSIEDRESQRIPIQLLVDYRANGNYLFDFCRDLGAGGIFIQTTSPLAHGSQVHLTFTLPDSKETLRAVGNVIWVQDRVASRQDLIPGMGVQFSDFSKSDRQKLEDFLKRTGKPETTSVPVSRNTARSA